MSTNIKSHAVHYDFEQARLFSFFHTILTLPKDELKNLDPILLYAFWVDAGFEVEAFGYDDMRQMHLK